jgi:poly(A) polymerase
VRDLMLGRIPSDFDVATSAPPEQVMSLFRRNVPVGARFGVITVLTPSSPIEVATFRAEAGYEDGRHPDSVTFTDAREDVLRRDFTINGLLYDPEEDRLIDFVGGLADLERGLIRAIGDPQERFAEDHLRLLRAIRFSARFDFEIEARTWEAVTVNPDRIRTVSAERVRDELTKILTQGNAHKGLELLSRSGLLARVLPEVAAMHGVEQPPEFHPEGDVYVHTRWMLEMMGPASLTLAWAVLLHDVGKPPTFMIADRIRFNGHDVMGAQMAEHIMKRLRFSNKDREAVVEMIRHHLRFMHAREMREAKLRRMIRMDHFDEHLALHRLDCLASHGGLDIHAFLVDRMAALDEEQLRPPRLVTGHDLIALGHPPGPHFKAILEAVEDLQLSGELTTREDALAWLRGHAAP